MTRTIQVGGTVTGIAGVYNNPVQRQDAARPGAADAGGIIVIGEATGGTLALATGEKIRSAGNTLIDRVKGDLLDGCYFCFTPSRNPRSGENAVFGATHVIPIRSDKSTRGSLNLQNGSSQTLVTLYDKEYGSSSAAATKEAGTLGAYGAKVTLSKNGFSDTIGDDLGYLPILAIRYKGAGSACTMSIDGTQLTTSVTGGPGGEDITASFTTYKYVKNLVDYINANFSAAYEVVTVTNKDSTYQCSWLDRVTTEDIFTETASAAIGTASATATTFTGTLTGLDDGDIIKLTGTGAQASLDAEYMYTTTAATPLVIREFMNSTGQTWSSADAVTFRGITGVNQAIVDWVNNSGIYATAEQPAASISFVGTPANISKTYFSGGGYAAADATSWQNALDEAKQWAEDAHQIVILVNDNSIDAKQITFMDWSWSQGYELFMHIGGADDATLAQIKSRAQYFRNQKNIAHWCQGSTRSDIYGASNNYKPWARACMAAGIHAGTGFGESINYKAFNETAVLQNSAIDIYDDDTVEDLIRHGVPIVRKEDGEFRCARELTCYTAGDEVTYIQPEIRICIAFVLRYVAEFVKARHKGRAARKGNANIIRGSYERALSDCEGFGAITAGSERVNGNVSEIPAYEVKAVDVNGSLAEVPYIFTPTGSTVFIEGHPYTRDFSDVA